MVIWEIVKAGDDMQYCGSLLRTKITTAKLIISAWMKEIREPQDKLLYLYIE